MFGLSALGRLLARSRAVAAISLEQLRYAPMQTALVTVAIALAVLAVTLLASTGFGVLETGQQGFEDAGRDLWITGGAVELTATGEIENPLVDAHEIAETAREHEDVESAAPLAFHGVYVSAGSGTVDGDGPGDEETQFVTAVGAPGTHGGLSLEDGDGFSDGAGDAHYANGGYDGPRADEVILDRSTAETLAVDVGDTVSVGSSREGDGRELTVVGISSEYSQFLGTPTVTIPLSELQSITGTTGSDRATYVTVALEDGADHAAVREDLESAFSAYEVRTNREQLESILGSQLLILASAVTLVVLAVLVGSVLTLNVLVLSVVQRVEELTALHLLGVSRGTLVGIVVCRSVLCGVIGGALGLAATPILAFGLDELAGGLVGFPDLLSVTPTVYALGAGVAGAISVFGALAVGWYLSSVVRGGSGGLE